jgi:hypothetical protein
MSDVCHCAASESTEALAAKQVSAARMQRPAGFGPLLSTEHAGTCSAASKATDSWRIVEALLYPGDALLWPWHMLQGHVTCYVQLVHLHVQKPGIDVFFLWELYVHTVLQR